VRPTVSLTSAAAARAVPEAQATPGPRSAVVGVPVRVVWLPAVVGVPVWVVWLPAVMEAPVRVVLGLRWATAALGVAAGSWPGPRPSSMGL